MASYLTAASTALGIVLSAGMLLRGLLRLANKLNEVNALTTIVKANKEATEANTHELKILRTDLVSKTVELAERVTRLENQ